MPLFTLIIDTAKALVMDRWKVTEHGPGYIHIPRAEWADDELAEQLTRERLVTKFDRGVPKQIWLKKRPLALCAMRLLTPRFDVMALRLRQDSPSWAGMAPQPPPPAPPTRRWSVSSYLTR